MKSKIFSFLLLCFLVFIPNVTLGADFISLVGIPGIDDKTVLTDGFGDYINTLYRLSISIAALLAVIKIVAAGAKYMLSDIVTSKEEAKKDIQGALVGLLIVIGAVIILNTVNTDITKNNIAIETLTIKDRDLTTGILANLNNRLKSASQVLCDSADKSKGERCLVADCASGIINKGIEYFAESCKSWCPNDFGGVYQPSLTGVGGKCTYLVETKPGDTIAVLMTGDEATDKTNCESLEDFEYTKSEILLGFGTEVAECKYMPPTYKAQVACESDPQKIWNETFNTCSENTSSPTDTLQGP